MASSPVGRFASLEGRVYTVDVPRRVPGKKTFVSVTVRFMYTTVNGRRKAVILQDSPARGRSAGASSVYTPPSGALIETSGSFLNENVFVADRVETKDNVGGRAVSELSKGSWDK